MAGAQADSLEDTLTANQMNSKYFYKGKFRAGICLCFMVLLHKAIAMTQE